MHFLNIGHAYENTARYTRAVLGEIPDPARLPVSYREAVSRHRPIDAPPEGSAIHYEDSQWGKYLRESDVFDGIFNGLRPSTPEERDIWPGCVAEAGEYVRDLNADLGRLVDLLVTDVILLPSDSTGGGSAAHLPGLVALSPGPHWTVYDFAESLVHEATHLNLFVGEMVHGLYTKPAKHLDAQEFRVLSAVKFGQLRPLDRAFHSAVVAVPLMWMQHQRGETELVDMFTGSLRECCQGLNAKRDLFTSYGQMLVHQLAEFAFSLDWDYVAESISDERFSRYAVAS
ncbi:aKG-HExxH-type peptide beta-hydroxylase [Nocardia farcinica]|uniref:aKG-HExxH-type peptide beta-hydroxylase n=1 Tax=Nocardia farcinica TaxID=37329 RepID=UPI0018956542|nr:HEXXH motif-containing putative peptide modification protein [Nocardia farcinica]MBF6139019.1 HEXXH motif domain-containing protein [Nocardia farcinica]